MNVWGFRMDPWLPHHRQASCWSSLAFWCISSLSPMSSSLPLTSCALLHHFAYLHPVPSVPTESLSWGGACLILASSLLAPITLPSEDGHLMPPASPPHTGGSFQTSCLLPPGPPGRTSTSATPGPPWFWLPQSWSLLYWDHDLI